MIYDADDPFDRKAKTIDEKIAVGICTGMMFLCLFGAIMFLGGMI